MLSKDANKVGQQKQNRITSKNVKRSSEKTSNLSRESKIGRSSSFRSIPITNFLKSNTNETKPFIILYEGSFETARQFREMKTVEGNDISLVPAKNFALYGKMISFCYSTIETPNSLASIYCYLNKIPVLGKSYLETCFKLGKVLFDPKIENNIGPDSSLSLLSSYKLEKQTLRDMCFHVFD